MGNIIFVYIVIYLNFALEPLRFSAKTSVNSALKNDINGLNTIGNYQKFLVVSD